MSKKIPDFLKYSVVFIGAIVLTACETVPEVKPPTTISSDPGGATIFINGTSQGLSPVSYLFDFSVAPEYEILAKLEGHFDKKQLLTTENRPGEQMTVSLEASQAWLATSPSEATNEWLRIRVNPDFTSEHVWRRMVDAVTANYVELEQFNYESGYLRSVYRAQKFPSPAGEFFVRNRFVATIASQEPLEYKIKVLSEWAFPGGKWQPYNRIFSEEAELVEQIRSRFGVL